MQQELKHPGQGSAHPMKAVTSARNILTLFSVFSNGTSFLTFHKVTTGLVKHVYFGKICWFLELNEVHIPTEDELEPST